jgi:hypothetical protein
MAKKDFKSFTADDILNAWLDALKKGLGPGKKFAPEITDPNGTTAKSLRTKINGQLKVVTFSAVAFRASTRVAKDLGTICGIMAAATKNKVVTLDVFQQARELSKLHASCPDPAKKGLGGGPFC